MVSTTTAPKAMAMPTPAVICAKPFIRTQPGGSDTTNTVEHRPAY